MKDTIHMRAPLGDGHCDTHDWPTDGMARRLIDAMHAHHGRGGINVCRDCLVRARDDAARAAGLPLYDATGTIAMVPTSRADLARQVVDRIARPAEAARDRGLLAAACERHRILAERVHASSPQGSERERSNGADQSAAEHAPGPRLSESGNTAPSAEPPPRDSTPEGRESP